MVCNELYNDQGLGNQLWNYAVTRVIAQRNGYDFSILKKERFKGQDFMDIDFGLPLSGGLTSQRGYLFTLPKGIISFYKERRELFGDTLSDMTADISRTDEQLLRVPDNTKIEGNCMSVKYLEGYRQDILKWLRIKDTYAQYCPEANVCIIHLRGGDFKHSQAFLPITYYKDAMAYIKSLNEQVVFQCVTDQKELAEKLLPGVQVIGSTLLNTDDIHRAGHHFGGPIGIDFCLMMRARYLIIPNSSFSWWAAYLNENKEVVVAPKYWARFNIADGFWSPADIITDGFTYLDKNGATFSPSECWSEKKLFEESHQDMFNANIALNLPWKKHSLPVAFLIFFAKKLPTVPRRIMNYLAKQ